MTRWSAKLASSALADFGVAWFENGPSPLDGRWSAGIGIGNQVVPVVLRIDLSRFTGGRDDMVQELMRAVDSAKSELVGSFLPEPT